MKLKGKVFKFGDDVNTDEIIPARYLYTSHPEELAKHCMEDADPDFVKKTKKGDMIVAGENFGCGSSREHAPLAVKSAGISCVIAKSFARIFYRNAINIGLPIFTSPEAAEAFKQGDNIVVDVNKGEISKADQEKSYRSEAFPDFIREIVKDGGLISYANKKTASSKKKTVKRKTRAKKKEKK